MKNKRGTTSPIITIGVILLIAILGFLAYNQFVQNIGGGGEVPIGTQCENEPYIASSTFNQYAKGTGVGVAYSYITDSNNGAGARTLTSGSAGTKFAVGDKIKILSSLSGYLDQVNEMEITKCGSNEFTNYIYEGDAITLTVLDQNFNALTDSSIGGTANVSASANNINVVVRLDGAVKKSTGQILLTLEANDTQVSEMAITAKSANARVIESNPNVYNSLNLFTAEGTAPTIKQAFVVDTILDGGQSDYNVKLIPESGVILGGGTLTGAIFVNAYAGQWFIDNDGNYKFGWETSTNKILKYEQKATDFDFLIE